MDSLMTGTDGKSGVYIVISQVRPDVEDHNLVSEVLWVPGYLMGRGRGSISLAPARIPQIVTLLPPPLCPNSRQKPSPSSWGLTFHLPLPR